MRANDDSRTMKKESGLEMRKTLGGEMRSTGVQVVVLRLERLEGRAVEEGGALPHPTTVYHRLPLPTTASLPWRPR